MSNQASFGDFTGAGDDEERPTAEAEAVAGNGAGTAEVVTGDSRYPPAEGTLSMAVTQVDYTVEGRGDEEYPVVHVFGRTPDGTREHVRVLEFEPYFYTPTADLDEDPVESYGSVLDARETGPDGEPFESIRGEQLTKIVARTPRDVGSIRDDFATTYEADILFPNRFLIDKGIGGGVAVPARRLDDGRVQVHHAEVDAVDVEADLRVNTFDIEVDDRNGFPEDGEEPIVCLTSHDSYEDEYVAWLFDAPAADAPVPTALDGYEQIDGDADVDLRTFEREDEMLDAFAAYIEETDPDVLTGWNCLPADSELQMGDGTTREIRAVEPGDVVVGSEGQTPATATVTNKWRSETEILEFDLADGTTLRSSADHRIMIGTDETVDWTEGADVEPGDYVVKPRTLPVDEPIVPTLTELVPLANQRFADEDDVKRFKEQLPPEAIGDLAEEFGVTAETLYHPHRDVWTPERCSNAATRYEVSLPDGGRDYRRTGVDLDRTLHEREAYLAGLVLTDGSMSRTDGIRFYNTREELHEVFPGDSSLEPDGTGCYKQNVLDYARMYAFNGLGIPFGNKNAGPVDLSPVYAMPEEYVARFLAGVIDGDGSVGTSVTVAAENTSIGDWYVRLFKRLGVYAERNGTTVRVPDAERDLSTLRERVLPHMRHPEKVKRLTDLNGGQGGRTEDIPYALFEAAAGTDERRIGRDKHRRGISLKRHETDREEWEEYVFVEVEGVESVGTETTYDIETTTHNFVAEGCLVHNCEDFDVPYVFDRMEEIGGASEYDLSPDRFSRVDEVWRGGWGGPDVKGRVVFDLLYAYKRTQFTELESYRLDAVAELELDVGKERYSGDIGDLWEQEPERLLEYNLRDVELCVEIDRKQSVIAFWDQVRRFVGCLLEDAPTPGDAVDVYVLHNAHGRFALPTKGQQEAEEFEGGAVFEPVTGVRENVTVLDLKSLYPMCMVTINASPETKVNPDEYDGETYHAPNGTHFRAEPDGMMREMVDELLTEREEKKERRDQYDPGEDEYVQFDRQQAATKVIMNCFTPDTEVLTPTGVRDVTDLAVGDEVYSLDPETMEMEVKPVVDTQAYPNYRDELVDIQTSKIDFRVTPNHRMLVRKAETNGTEWDDYRFVEAGDLDRAGNYQLPYDWDGPDGDRIDRVDLTELVDEFEVWCDNDVRGHTLKAEVGWCADKIVKNDLDTTGYVFDANEFDQHREYLDEHCSRFRVHAERGRKWVQRFYDGDDFLDLLAWYITEGSVSTSETTEFDGQLRGSATSIKIAQDAPETTTDGVATDGGESDHAAIGCLLDRMGFDCYVDERSYQFTSRLLGRFLERTCGANSFEKRIPDLVFEASREQKRRFLDTLVAGDGDRQSNSVWRYTTSSERLRDDVLRLCAHLGLTANYSHDSGSWRIYCGEDAKNTLRMYRSSDRSTADDGVYCVTVADNHTLLAGRNGRFQFVGQSLYGVSGWDRFRLYDKENAAAVTATGREVLSFTEEAAGELGYPIAYGDTDSVMLELGGDVTKAEAIERSFDIEAHINDRYDDFAREQLGAEEHRFQIEFEKLYRRFFQAGKKKRYAGHIVWKEGKDVDDIDITGFEYKRSDIAQVTKRVQRDVIEMIVRGEDLSEVKEFLHEEITAFESGERSLAEVGIPGGIGKRLDAYDTDTAQVRGARYANRLLGTNFGRGSKPKRVYLRKVHPAFFRRLEDEEGFDPATDPVYAEFKRDPDVICFEYDDQVPEAFEVDWERMLEKTLQGPIARVIEALGMSWDEVRSGQTQTGLGQFG